MRLKEKWFEVERALRCAFEQRPELIDVQNSSTFFNGAFAGLSEGAFFNVGGEPFHLFYVGGTGRDLVVAAIPEPATTAIIAGIGVLAFA